MFPGTSKTETGEITIAAFAETLDGTTLAAPALLEIVVQGFKGDVLRECESMLSQLDLVAAEAPF